MKAIARVLLARRVRKLNPATNQAESDAMTGFGIQCDSIDGTA
jgi:hypothetical protein